MMRFRVQALVFMATVAAGVGAAVDAQAVGNHGVYSLHPRDSRSSVSAPFAGGPDTQCGIATYCGGPVISNVQIVPVYWTSQVASQTTSWAPGYCQGIADSELLDMLSEYTTAGKTGTACGMLIDGGLEYFGPTTPFTTNQTITRGTSLTAVTITPTMATGTSLDDNNATIGLEIVGQIAAGKVPAPSYDAQGYPNTLYMVFFPRAISITAFGGNSCSDFGGYHQSVTYTAPAGCSGQYIPYAVIPDCGQTGDQLADVVSHELAEAISDTDVGPTSPMTANYGDGAWYLGPDNTCTGNNCPSTCGEIGDVCQSAGDGTIPGTSPGITSQEIWSQAQNGCGLNNPAIGTQPPPSGPPLMVCENTPPDSGTGMDSGMGTDSGTGGVDAGMDSGMTQMDSGTTEMDSGMGTDSGVAMDSGRPPPPRDSGNPPNDATVQPGDDAGSSGGTVSASCSCSVLGSQGGSAFGAGFGTVLALMVLGGRRRTKRGRSAKAARP